MPATQPVIAEVTITPWEDDPRYVVVGALWSAEGLDRTDAVGFVVSKAVAPRLKRAILDGKVYTDPEIKTDINGKTYVSSGHAIMAKYANADLRRLGY